MSIHKYGYLNAVPRTEAYKDAVEKATADGFIPVGARLNEDFSCDLERPENMSDQYLLVIRNKESM